MKRIIILLIVLVVISKTHKVNAQLPTVVSAPIAEANLISANTLLGQQTGIMATMNTVIGALEKADKTYKEAMEKSTWLQNMETAARILFMIENLICTSKNLNARMGLSDNNCLYAYRYDMMLIKVQQSTDYLSIILTAGVTMTAAERMKTLDNVVTSYEDSQEMMVRLNKALDTDLMRMRMARSSKNTLKNLYSINRSKSGRR